MSHERRHEARRLRWACRGGRWRSGDFEVEHLHLQLDADGTWSVPVTLREGDLAFLHVHPDEDGLAFMAEFPSSGRHRLYLQFRHDGRVRIAGFTHEVSS